MQHRYFLYLLPGLSLALAALVAGGQWITPARGTYGLQGVAITEIMACNRLGLVDEDQQRPDWIELYHGGSEVVNLAGWSLTDDPARPRKWMFPAVPFLPGQHIVVFASGKDRRPPGGQLHTNFRLDRNGEYLALFGPDSEEPISEFSPSYPPLTKALSFGLKRRRAQQEVSEADLCFFSRPTPGRINAEPAREYLEPPVFSRHRGVVDEPFALTLSGPSEIRYTTDGSAPGPAHGHRYEHPIPIERTTVVRAVTCDQDAAASTSLEQVHSYIFPKQVMNQTRPDGAPTRWHDREGNAHRLRYRLDPRVMKIEQMDASAMARILRSIPTVSITTAPDKLFGPEGLYDKGGQRGRNGAFERPASIEYIPADGGPGFGVGCGLQPHSNPTAKRSLNVCFKGRYGPKRLHAPIFESAPLNRSTAPREVNQIILRAGSNMKWGRGRFLRHSQAQYVCYTRDQYVRDAQIAMTDGAGSHGTFVHLYLNGLYWGLYNLVEKYDESFCAIHFGGRDEDWMAVEPSSHTESAPQKEQPWRVISGSAKRFERLLELAEQLDLSRPEAYEQVSRLLDLDQFIDFLVVQWWAGSGDMFDKNWFAAQRMRPPGPVRFFVWDAEYSFFHGHFPQPAGHWGGAWVPYYFEPEWLQDHEDTREADILCVRLWRALWRNPQFRMRFADRVARHCYEGAFVEKRARLRWCKLNQFIKQAVVGESARWGGPQFPRKRPLTRKHHWGPAVYIVDQMLQDNTENFIHMLRRAGFYPQTQRPCLKLLRKQENVELPVLARVEPANEAYYTVNGTDPRTTDGAVAEAARKLTIRWPGEQREVLGPGCETWFTIPTDDRLEKQWAKPGPLAHRTRWQRGVLPLRLNEDRRQSTRTESDLPVNILKDGSSLYVRIPFRLEDPKRFDSMRLDIQFNDGFVAMLNGRRLCAANAPEPCPWNARAHMPPPWTTDYSREKIRSIWPRWAHTAGPEQPGYTLRKDVSQGLKLLRSGRNLLAIQLCGCGPEDTDLFLSPRLILDRGAAGMIPARVEQRVWCRARGPDGEWSALTQLKVTRREGDPREEGSRKHRSRSGRATESYDR